MVTWRTFAGLVVLGVLAACGTKPMVVTPAAGTLHVQQACPRGLYLNPSYDPRFVAEGNRVAFRLRGETTWRPGCVSAPDIVEENATSFRRAGSRIWERK